MSDEEKKAIEYQAILDVRNLYDGVRKFAIEKFSQKIFNYKCPDICQVNFSLYFKEMDKLYGANKLKGK